MVIISNPFFIFPVRRAQAPASVRDQRPTMMTLIFGGILVVVTIGGDRMVEPLEVVV